MTITYRSDFDVDLIDHMGDDQRVCQAARVSTQGADSLDSDTSAGLVKYLMKNRHGSPFEHVVFTWRISAPIFVWREFMRHRIASYNEESGRYKQLDPVFYVPDSNRKLLQVGKPGHYEFVTGTLAQWEAVTNTIEEGCSRAYNDYVEMLEQGIAKEVARMILPVDIYSTAYVTMNLRGLMNFLSLRTRNVESMFPSFPQWEISAVADLMEKDFARLLPVTHSAFLDAGRVQP